MLCAVCLGVKRRNPENDQGLARQRVPGTAVDAGVHIALHDGYPLSPRKYRYALRRMRLGLGACAASCVGPMHVAPGLPALRTDAHCLIRGVGGRESTRCSGASSTGQQGAATVPSPFPWTVDPDWPEASPGTAAPRAPACARPRARRVARATPSQAFAKAVAFMISDG